jgi:hypothetical protein
MAADVSWIPPVVRAATLTIDASKVHGPAWNSAVAGAIRELNTLFKAHKLNVTLKTGDSAVVEVALSSGTFTFPIDGKDHSGTLRTDILHGATKGIDRETRGKLLREKAYVFLPAQPKISPQASARTVGEPVMRVMMAHEFLHALGLVEHDPGLEGLLAARWTFHEGTKAAGDAVSPFGSAAKMPPLTLSADTVTRLQALWP